MTKPREEFIELIKENIERDGYHVYFISGGSVPRYAYTIGARAKFGGELIFAGGAFYSNKEVLGMIDLLYRMPIHTPLDSGRIVFAEGGRDVHAQPVHHTWSDEMILGAFDFHSDDSVSALQIMPDERHKTLDVPNMSLPWSADREPVWKWLREPWLFPVPEKSVVFTNLDALNGQRVTEVMRWETEEWEMFAGYGPDVEKKDARAVPLGTLLGIDSSLNEAVGLEVGKGLWREDSELRWHKWN